MSEIAAVRQQRDVAECPGGDVREVRNEQVHYIRKLTRRLNGIFW